MTKSYGRFEVRFLLLAIFVILSGATSFAEPVGFDLPIANTERRTLSAEVVQVLKYSGRTLLEKAGLYERFKKAVVAIVARPDLKTITVNGTPLDVVKYLGSGMNGDAYIVDYFGTPVVAKISRGTAVTRAKLLESIPVHRYAREVMHINSPHLIAYDPAGDWELSELVLGESLEKRFERGEPLSESLRLSIRLIFEQAAQLKKQKNIYLDLAPDNILIRDDRALLVDLGPLTTRSELADQFDATIARWQGSAKKRIFCVRAMSAAPVN